MHSTLKLVIELKGFYSHVSDLIVICMEAKWWRELGISVWRRFSFLKLTVKFYIIFPQMHKLRVPWMSRTLNHSFFNSFTITQIHDIQFNHCNFCFIWSGDGFSFLLFQWCNDSNRLTTNSKQGLLL